jgi:hypothetical protein
VSEIASVHTVGARVALRFACVAYEVAPVVSGFFAVVCGVVAVVAVLDR